MDSVHEVGDQGNGTMNSKNPIATDALTGVGCLELMDLRSHLSCDTILQEREINDSFWNDFQIKCHERLNLYEKLLPVLSEAQDAISSGSERVSEKILQSPIYSQSTVKRISQSILDADPEYTVDWQKIRGLNGALAAYIKRLSHLSKNTGALGDERPPDSANHIKSFDFYKQLVSRMAASGELAEREIAFRNHIEEQEHLRQERSTRYQGATVSSITPQDAVEAEPDDHGQAEYLEAMRRLVDDYYSHLLDIGDRFRPWYEEHNDPRPPMQRPQNPLAVSSVLPSYTFVEARTLQRAIGDGPSLQHWAGVEGEIAMRHVIPGERLHTKFVPSARLREYRQWALPGADEGQTELLGGELRRLEFDTTLLFSVCLSLVIERGTFNVSLDEPGKLLGWQPKLAEERDQDRLRLWAWLLLFDSLRVIGLRKGIYPDPDDKKKIRDLSSDDDLLHISGTLADVQQRLDNVPFEVSLTSGPWIEKMRGDRSILTYLGNVKALAAKPRRRFPARLAVKIGVALLQNWRERATHEQTQIKHPGDENKLSISFAPFTRKELMTTYGQEAAGELERLLFETDDPGRAVKYWKQAIKYLTEWGIIGYEKALEPRMGKGHGWQKWWYEEQLVDVRPSLNLASDIAEVHRAKKAADKKKAANRKK